MTALSAWIENESRYDGLTGGAKSTDIERHKLHLNTAEEKHIKHEWPKKQN